MNIYPEIGLVNIYFRFFEVETGRGWIHLNLSLFLMFHRL